MLTMWCTCAFGCATSSLQTEKQVFHYINLDFSSNSVRHHLKMATPETLEIAPPTALIGALFLLTAILVLLLKLHQNYLTYLALGPGGTPSTFMGFAKVQALGFLAAHYSLRQNPVAVKTVEATFADAYLSHLAERKGERPIVRGIAPHRQITQKIDRALYEKFLYAFATASPFDEGMVLNTSCFERHGPALFARRPVAKSNEICHLHPSDGSMHMILSPTDSEVVLKAGWGERHPLALGGWFERFVPVGFVMVYAPRDEGEIETVLRIVRAAAWYVCGAGGMTELNEKSSNL